MGLIIRSSSIHAAGCYTTASISQGTRIVEYTGPLIDKDEADVRYENKPITYLFGIGDGTKVIDGHGIAMFINHSCDANCETEEMDGHVWIMATRDIAAGEELCYDYCLYDGDGEEAPCHCGARNCRGSMYSPEELRKRKRLTRTQGSKSSRTAHKKNETRESQKAVAAKHLKKTSATPKTQPSVNKAAGKKLTPRADPKKAMSRKVGPPTIRRQVG